MSVRELIKHPLSSCKLLFYVHSSLEKQCDPDHLPRTVADNLQLECDICFQSLLILHIRANVDSLQGLVLVSECGHERLWGGGLAAFVRRGE